MIRNFFKRVSLKYKNELYKQRKENKITFFGYINFLLNFLLIQSITLFFKKKFIFIENINALKKLLGIIRYIFLSIYLNLFKKLLHYLAPLPILEVKKQTYKINFSRHTLDVYGFNSLVDERYLIWKKDALILILHALNKYKKKIKKVKFAEVGAANAIVSLFLKKILNKNKTLQNSQIFVFEPSNKCVNTIYENSKLNNLSIKILPIAVSKKNEFSNFMQASNKGYVLNSYNFLKKKFKNKFYNNLKAEKVSDVALKITYDNLKAKVEEGSVLSLDTKIIKEVIPDINILYIDAKKNEKFLLEILLKRFKNIKILVIEFDYDIDDRSKKLLKKNKFSIIEKDSVNNYLIVNNRILN